jgi:hypothetical protein
MPRGLQPGGQRGHGGRFIGLSLNEAACLAGALATAAEL